MTEKHLSEENRLAAEKSLIKAKEAVLFLLDFEIPMTEARQMIYNAWWLYEFGRIDEMNMHLDEANHLLATIKEHDTPSLFEAIGEIRGQIDDVKLTVKKEYMQIRTRSRFQGPNSVAMKFSKLNDKIYLLMFDNYQILPEEDNR